MYLEYIKEYNNKITKYKMAIEKAKQINVKCVKMMFLLYIIPFLISLVLPDPLFKIPIVWPIISLGISSVLSLPIYKTYRETNIIIDGVLEKIEKLSADITDMKKQVNEHSKQKKKNNISK